MIAAVGWIVVLASLLAGCAGSFPVRFERSAGNPLDPGAAPTADGRDIFRGVPGKYRALAASAEKAGDLRRALLYRKVVSGLAPEDADAPEHVDRLERRIRVQVDRHYRAALALEENGESAKALREFLAVLVLDPENEAAFRRVKNWKNGGEAAQSRSWKVREGDTLRKIAGKVYGDPDMEFLVAYFNRLPAGSPLPVGTGLRLPDIDTGTAKKAEKVPAYSPPAKEGNASPNLVERKEDADRKHREAEVHYEAGMRRFLAEDLDGAIGEWEKALSLDPAHPKARRDLDKAQRLKGKIETPK